MFVISTIIGLGATGVGVALAIRRLRQARVAGMLQLRGPASIDEAGFVHLGGLEQWVTIRGEDRHNPVLLVLHGGPASTYTPLAALLRPWERHFTIAQWDQRGAGKTFGRNGPTGELTFAQLVADATELVEHLQHALGQPRIILLGSSVGSVTGLTLAKRHPELFHAFVATDLNVGTDPGGQAFQAMLDHLRVTGRAREAKALERLGADSTKWSFADWNRRNRIITQVAHGVPHMINDVLLPSLLSSPNHSMRDLLDFARGMAFSGPKLFDELMAYDARSLGLHFEVPVFVFQGDADWATPTLSAKRYFDELTAPIKHFALIEHAGHLAAFARPERFLELLLAHVRPLAQP